MKSKEERLGAGVETEQNIPGLSGNYERYDIHKGDTRKKRESKGTRERCKYQDFPQISIRYQMTGLESSKHIKQDRCQIHMHPPNTKACRVQSTENKKYKKDPDSHHRKKKHLTHKGAKNYIQLLCRSHASKKRVRLNIHNAVGETLQN